MANILKANQVTVKRWIFLENIQKLKNFKVIIMIKIAKYLFVFLQHRVVRLKEWLMSKHEKIFLQKCSVERRLSMLQTVGKRTHISPSDHMCENVSHFKLINRLSNSQDFYAPRLLGARGEIFFLILFHK